ncbi:NAD(P)H dehydrogenase [Amycolatopsis acidicola]|uniref:FMN dependent NADH:quinone oxidoreductase n=1 Tax=Amycolatopsis acidicola TaxID=2596893 RepID=A0A5N0UT68_9PSEU|nr:NAD(P)H-dependent oxidoreductase [Amycolatopsis acidicola]KAA9153165.1 NAD(P)H dehydrogenase [Amycolatopsis acidicola]
MTNLLHVDSSAGPAGLSVSRELTARFAATWREHHGDAGYRYRDVVADPVPLVNPAYVTLGTRVERLGTVPRGKIAELAESAAEEREWALTDPLVEEVLAAGTVLIGTPMYNFSVPAALKAWIDRITFPGVFTDPGTGESLLAATRVVIVAARGGGYGPGSPREGFDFQEPFLRKYFENLGVTDFTFIHADLTRAADIPQLHALRDLGAASYATAADRVVQEAGGGAVKMQNG